MSQFNTRCSECIGDCNGECNVADCIFNSSGALELAVLKSSFTAETVSVAMVVWWDEKADCYLTLEKFLHVDSIIDEKHIYRLDASMALLIFFKHSCDVKLLSSEFKKELCLIETLLNHTIGATIGIGRCCTCFSQLYTSYKEALIACNYHFVNPLKRVIWFEDMFNEEKDDVVRYDKCLSDIIRTGDESSVRVFFNEWLKQELFTKKKIPVRQIQFGIIYILMNIIKEFQSLGDISLNNEIFDSAISIQKTYEYSINVLLCMCRDHHALMENGVIPVIKEAKKFINENYLSEITLNDVAKKVNLNPNYFSHLFATNMGLTFSKYLTSLRIDKAKKILRENTYLKIYEIAGQVGYKDIKHFLKVFKREEGIVPSKYQTKYQDTNNR